MYEHVANRNFKLKYLYHSSDSDFNKHWNDIRNNPRSFFYHVRKRIGNMDKLKGLAIILDNLDENVPYAIFAVLEDS